MTNIEFVQKIKKIATEDRTLYVSGGFGAPLNAKNKERYKNNNEYNRQPARRACIDAATDRTFAFDCVGLVKGVLWGFDSDHTKTYGGAVYKAGGVPDVNQEGMIKLCTDVSSKFKDIPLGSFLYLPGHCGVYIGDGLAVECTPKWYNKVQITAVSNMGQKSGYNARKWTKWGKLPYIEYKTQEEPKNGLTGDFTIKVDGVKKKCHGYIQNGTTWIMLRDLAAIGVADVSWDDVEKVPVVNTHDR